MKQVMCALLFFLAACSDEPPPQPKAVETEYFDRVWNDSAGKVALAAAAPKKVFTERIIPTDDPAAMPEVVMNPEPEVALPPRSKASRFIRTREREAKRNGRDVCQRHGQRKVFVGKYKWRCRK